MLSKIKCFTESCINLKNEGSKYCWYHKSPNPIEIFNFLPYVPQKLITQYVLPYYYDIEKKERLEYQQKKLLLYQRSNNKLRVNPIFYN